MQMTKQQQKEFRSFCDRVMRGDGPRSLATIYEAMDLIAEQLFGVNNRPACGEMASDFLQAETEIIREKQDIIVQALMAIKSLDRYGFNRGALIGVLSRHLESCGEGPEAFKSMIAHVEGLPITEDRMQRVAA